MAPFAIKPRSSMITIELAIILISLLTFSSSSSSLSKCYKSIISLGDSQADTGNLPLLNLATIIPASALPPYGRTFFHRPTGRYCDGRLVIDFIAEYLGKPFVPAYMEIRNRNSTSWNLEKGVNFAMAGATAVDTEFYEKRGIVNPSTNLSLANEMDWLNQIMNTIPDGRKFLRNSLILVGEIGINDYNHPLTQGRTIQEVRSFVPRVVNTIGKTIQKLIKLGARTMLVSGISPIGCLPRYLTLYMSTDYYNALIKVYKSPKEFGFSGGVLKACCGAGGLYNYNKSAICGSPEATFNCDDPSSFISWDGIHNTEAAYRLMTRDLLEGPFSTIPQIKTVCSSS